MYHSNHFRAKEVLADITEGLKRDWKEPLKLEFCGVGNFGNSVVYVKVKDGPAKDKLHQISGRAVIGFAEYRMECNLQIQSGFHLRGVAGESSPHKVLNFPPKQLKLPPLKFACH